jgi:transmembrane sensor
MQNKELIEKWLSDSLSQAELESFRQTDDFRALARLDEALQDYRASEYDVEAALEALDKARRPAGKIIRMRPLDMALRVAAAVSIVLLGYLLIFQNKVTNLSTGIGEKQMVNLPDQSSIRLNATSSLVFNADNWDKERNVELKGEAYFVVAKGSRFDVNTKDGIISVLGTQFNVKSREAYFEVSCYEGHVAVVANEDTVQLLAGNGVRFIEGDKLLLQVKGVEPTWANNESSFESVPFAEVVAEFERQFDVSITTKNVDLTKRYSGSFSHIDFEVALKSISAPLNLTIEKTSDKHIVLSAVKE